MSLSSSSSGSSSGESAGMPTWQCDVCLRRFVSRNSMRHHQQLVHSGSEQRCEWCRKALSSRTQLVAHVRRAHGDAEPTAAAIAVRRARDARANRGQQRAAACAQCGKALFDAAQVRRHVVKAHGTANVSVGADEQLPATGDLVDADYYCPLCHVSYDDDHNTCIACEECERFFHASCDHVVDVSLYDDDRPNALMYVCSLCCQDAEADVDDRAAKPLNLAPRRPAAAAAAAAAAGDDLCGHAIAAPPCAHADPTAAGPFAEPLSAANYAGLELHFPLDLIAAADVELRFAAVVDQHNAKF